MAVGTGIVGESVGDGFEVDVGSAAGVGPGTEVGLGATVGVGTDDCVGVEVDAGVRVGGGAKVGVEIVLGGDSDLLQAISTRMLRASSRFHFDTFLSLESIYG